MRKLHSVIVMMLVAVTVCAQEASVKNVGKRDKVYYFQLTGGVNYSMSENTRFFNVSDNIRPVFDLSFGKEFNPYWSSELQLGYNRNRRIYDERMNGEILYTKTNFNSMELFWNGAYNLSNGIGGFNPERKCNVYVYAGIGLAYTFGTEDNKDESYNNFIPGARAGLTCSYAFSKRVAAIADVSFYAFTDNFNSFKRQIPADARLHAQIGARIYLGKEGSKKWVREPEVQFVEKLVVRTDTIRVKERIVEEVVKDSPSKIETIFFAINSAEIRKDEMSKVREIANYLKSHPDKVVIVIGSADRNTGSEGVNSRLRASRARAISEMLVKEFGIDSSRVKPLMGKGEKEDLYQKQYEKNRAAICVITDFRE